MGSRSYVALVWPSRRKPIRLTLNAAYDEQFNRRVSNVNVIETMNCGIVRNRDGLVTTMRLLESLGIRGELSSVENENMPVPSAKHRDVH